MVETMIAEPTEKVSAPMCPCGKRMGFQENEKSWRCLACNPIPMDAPICKTQICKRPLTWLKESGCWRCLHCNPIREVKPTERRRKKYLDVTMTEDIVTELIKEQIGQTSVDEERIREIVQDELANWHIPEPPMTRAEITTMVETLQQNAVPVEKPETYMQKAKRLNVATHHSEGGIRKKADVLSDIKAVEKTRPEVKDETIQEELLPEEQAGSGGGERPPVDTGSPEVA